jgi:hypothetical protein
MIFFLGYASVASMTMGLIIPALFIWLYWTGVISGTVAYIIGGTITALIVAFALRSNFVRLLQGEERLVGLRARQQKKQSRNQEQKSKINFHADESIR